ncbi:hypothetical protein HYQ46_011129 [Verticillium longisporum]|nr:hypothetical protein HYQ46_011129 [Verticillium longisporum]
MHIQLPTLVAALQILPVVSAAGFHLFDRRMTWNYEDCQDGCPKKSSCCGNIFTAVEDVSLIPSNQYNCDTIRNKNYIEGPEKTSHIGHGTVIRGQCGSRSLTLYPVSNGNELEVWESGGSKMYGKCYRQDGGKKLTCDDNGGLACRGIEGEPKQGSCKISVTDVWVCPVSLC